VVALLPLILGTSALQCWTCKYSASNAECNLKGGLEKCENNEDACQTHVRRIGGGVVIRKECKASDACSNNAIQNGARAYRPVQCNLNRNDQVCRCCCGETGCNKHLFSQKSCFSQLFPRSQFTCSGNPLVFDVVGVIDSSSSITLRSWGLEVDLFSQILMHFSVGGAVRAGAFHYNNKIYTSSQIHLNQVESHLDLVERIGDWRYEGVGTYTGAALSWAQNNALSPSNGNREGVRDVVILITDGVSQDSYEEATLALQQSGVHLIVVGIGPKAYRSEIASISSNYFPVANVYRNFEFTARRIALHITQTLCPGGPWLPPASPPLRRNRCRFAPRSIRHGSHSCTNGREIGSMCTFSCDVGYRFHHHTHYETVCKTNRYWTQAHPVCIVDTRQCGNLQAPVGGSMSCTKSIHNRVYSDCHFTCDAPGFIVGQSKLECRPFGQGDNDVAWDFVEPICASVQCPVETPVDHGTVECSFDNNVGSVCEHVCKEGFTHYPPDRNVSTCGMNPDGETASFRPRPKPCCVDAVRLETETCDVLPALDIVVVVDSSSSVKTENWAPQMNFVKQVVSIFDVGINKTRIGVFRYNKLIDSDTEIKLSDATNNEDLLASIDKIPYNGSGTRTGQAIQYALDAHLSADYGNRPDIDDFVIVITDGKSQDDVIVPSNALRNSPAMVFAVGVGLKPNGIKTMNEIAGAPEYAFNVVGGFSALQDTVGSISDLLKGTICHPCNLLREPVVPVAEASESSAIENAIDAVLDLLTSE